MNAYGLSSEKTRMILNNQFQAVRKGVFTYEEFTSAIGNLLPYGASVDQTLATITGGMAFMSRNGFTAAQSSISVARALDQLMRKRPEMKDVFGVDIVDKATGDYKQLGQIIQEMSQKMTGLTNPQIAKKLQDVFGAGEIRANRFFRIAIPHQQQLNDLIGQMGGPQVAGQMDKAWRVMRQTPAVQWAKFIEKGKALLVMLGNALLPILQDFIHILSQIMHWFADLSPETKKWIMYIAMLAGVFLVVTGVVMQFIGSIALIASALAFTEGAALFAWLAGAAVAIGALIVIGIILWRNWDKIKPVLIAIWNGIKDAFFAAWNAIKAVASAVWGWMYDYLVAPMLALIKLYIAIWTAIFKIVYDVIMAVWNFIKPVVMGLVSLWVAEFNIIWAIVKFAFDLIWNIISGVIGAVIVIWKGFWAIFAGVAKATWAVLWAVIKTYVQIMWVTIKNFTLMLIAAWRVAWSVVKVIWNTVGRPVWQAVVSFVKGVLWPVLKTVFSALTAAWRAVWGAIKDVWNAVGKPVFEAVKSAFKAVWDFLKTAFHAITGAWSSFWGAVKSIFFGIINGILAGVEGFVNGIIDAINWVRTKFGLDAMGHITLARAGGTGTGGGGSNTGTGVTGAGRGAAGLAKGTDYWRGGWAWVGERGPELAFLPRGSAVIPSNLSSGMNMAKNLPGFGLGLLASSVVSRALSAVGVRMPSLPGVFADLGPAILKQVTDWFKNSIHYILGGSPSAHSGGTVARSGFAYVQQGEMLQSARVVRDIGGMAGGRELHVHIEPQKAVVDTLDMIHELDWYERTRGLTFHGG